MRNDIPQISVLDDDSAVRKALVKLLQTRNYDVQVFSSADEFLATIDGNKSICLVVDYQMPGMTGLDLQLLFQKAGIDTPVIIISAHDEASVRARCLEAGASAFLVKPIDGSVLLSVIDQVIKSGVAVT